jgi:hypothetical protein
LLRSADEKVNTSEENRVLRPIVRTLGAARYEPALALIQRIYTSHPRVNLRMAAGHALLDFGSEEALSPLPPRFRVWDRPASSFAAKAAFRLDPQRAFDLSGMGDACSRRAALQLFKVLKPLSRDKWIDIDPRWAQFLAVWRKDEVLADTASSLLKKYPKKIREVAIKVAEEEEVARRPSKAIEVPTEKELASWCNRTFHNDESRVTDPRTPQDAGGDRRSVL